MKNIKVDLFLLVGIVVSISTSLLLFFKGGDTATSVLVGLVCSVVTLQIDLFARIDRIRSESDEARVVLGKVQTASMIAPELLEIIDSINRIGTRRDEILIDAAKREVGETSDKLQIIAGGRIELDFWHSDILFKSARKARGSIRAVSPMDADMDWWTSTIGNNYLELHREAIARGVKIIRIFPVEGLDDSAISILDRQHAIGIVVMTVSAPSLPKELLDAYVLFDSDSVNQTIFSGGKESNLYSVKKVDVEKFDRFFERTLALSTVYAPKVAS